MNTIFISYIKLYVLVNCTNQNEKIFSIKNINDSEILASIKNSTILVAQTSEVVKNNFYS